MKPQEFFAKLAAELPNIERRIANDIIAVEAEDFHIKNFRNEGFTDVTLSKWPARKKEDKNPKKRALLIGVGTGNLRGYAIKGRTHGNQVDFIFPIDYAIVHNEGLRAGRGKGFDMPKRQFVGQSAYLDKKIKEKAQRYLDQYLKNL